ncbi:MAG TPA: hypothetical protein VEV83_00840, partial [Parafilimonas sp.]|nr:hypothetical protein [Parafilimonas sp.]
MKKIILIILLFTYCKIIAQNKEVKLDDLKTPNSPGFQILDISPSSIERPTNPKEFALKVFNLTNNGSALPKNFAFEIAPYWFAKPQNTNLYKYLNIKYSDESGTHNNIATGIYNKLNLSLASSFSDSIAGSLLANTNYISFGVRTNLITLRTKQQNQALNTLFVNISKRLGQLSDDLDQKANLIDQKILFEQDSGKRKILEDSVLLLTRARAQLVSEAAEKDILYKSYLEDSLPELSTPLFQLDAAYAYSEAFPNNEYADKRFNRSGLWATATLSSTHLALIILG